MKKIVTMSLLLVGTLFLTGCTTTVPNEIMRAGLESEINKKVDANATVAIGDKVGAKTNEYFGDIKIKEFKQCPLPAPGEDDILIMFADYPRSNGTSGLGSWVKKRLRLPWISDVTVPAGRYEVSLAAYDSYECRYLTPSSGQLAERFRVEVKTSPTYSIKTNSTGDLKEFYKTAVWKGKVNSDDEKNTGDAYIAGKDSIKIRAIHSKSKVTPGKSNSVSPICALFKKLPFPEKECPFEATGKNILVNFNSGIRSDKGADRAEASADVNIPVGDYKVSLYAYDASTYRADQAQLNEKYYVDLLDNNGNSITKTSETKDLEDNVQIATNASTVVVDEELTVNKKAVTAVARHSAYPDTSDANSVKAVCALFEDVSADEPETCTPSYTYECVKNSSEADCTQNCGQSPITVEGVCYEENSCDSTQTRVLNSKCGTDCRETEIVDCPACPDIIDWVEVAP